MSDWPATISRTFPQAMPIDRFGARLLEALGAQGITPERALLATSLCRDELTRHTVGRLRADWGEQFDLGGLAGLPTAGRTGFSAYRQHVPDDGWLLIVYGPHIGIDAEGAIGVIHRPQMARATTACGAIAGFVGKVQADPAYAPELDMQDLEQGALETLLHPHARAALASPDPLLHLTRQLVGEIGQRIERLHAEVTPPIPAALVGGLLIHTPEDAMDHFLPGRAELIEPGGTTQALAL